MDQIRLPQVKKFAIDDVNFEKSINNYIKKAWTVHGESVDIKTTSKHVLVIIDKLVDINKDNY